MNQSKVRQLPIKMPDGTVIYPQLEENQDYKEILDEKSSIIQEEIDEESVHEEVPKTKIDFMDNKMCRMKIAKYCELIMQNPEDKTTINSLFNLINDFDKSGINNLELQRDIDISLEILLRNCREEGPLNQLKNVYNYRMDRKYSKLINNTLQGHESAYKQLKKYLSTDQTFFIHQKISYLAFQQLKKRKFQADSPIFFNLFLESNVTKITNLIPKFKQKSKKQKQSKEDEAKNANSQGEIKENQSIFLSNILHLCFKVIKEYQNSSLLQTSFNLIAKFGPFLNTDIYEDLLSVIKMFFYNWFNENFVKNKQNLTNFFKLIGEEESELFSIKVTKEYRLHPEINQIINYINNHKDSLCLFTYKSIFRDFDLVLNIINILTQDMNYDDSIQKSNGVLLVYLIANIYKINSEDRCKRFLRIIKQLGAQNNQQQFSFLIVKLRKYLDMKSFNDYADSLCLKYGIDKIQDDD